jgi:hypothetical protein
MLANGVRVSVCARERERDRERERERDYFGQVSHSHKQYNKKV